MISRRLWVTLCWVIIPIFGLLGQTRCAIYGKYQNKPLNEVLHHLEKQCNTTFSMDESELSRYAVTKNFKGAFLPTVLDILLAEVGYEYEFQAGGNPTIIRPRPEVDFQITGTIIDDSTGLPLYMATAQCASRPHIGTNTNQAGHFSFSFRTNKPEQIVFSYVGKRKKIVTVSPVDPIRHFRLRLRDKVIQYGVDITSGGELKVKIEDAAGKISIDPSDIGYLSGLGEADVFRSLQLLPGVTVGDESAAGLNIRGGEADQNLVLLDGITLYEPNHFFGLVSAFNNQAIKDVKLYRGAYDARFGGRVSSVIEVIGRPHKRQKNRMGGALNIMNANLYREKHFKEHNISFMVAGRRSYGDWIQNRLFDKLLTYQIQEGSIARNLRQQLLGNASQSPAYWFGDVNFKVAYTTPKKDRITFTTYGGLDHLSFKYRDWQPNSYQESTHNFLNQRSLGGSLSWQRAWNKEVQSFTTLAHSAFYGKYQYAYEVLTTHAPQSRLIVQQNQIEDWTLRHRSEIEPSDLLKVEAGLEANLIAIEADYILKDMRDTAVRRQVLPGRQLVAASYGQGTYQLTDQVSFQAGLRGTYYTGTEKLYLAPRASLMATLLPGLKTKATFGRYNQFLSKIVRLNDVGMGESFWMVAGYDNVPVIQADHSVLGLTYSQGPWDIDLEFYHKSLSNTFTYDVVYDPVFQQYDPDTANFLTGGQARSRGLDLLVKYKHRAYTGWVSYSLANTTYQFEELNEGQPYAPNQDKRHVIKIVQILEFGPHDRWNLSVSWLFDSGRPFTTIEDIDRIDLAGGNESLVIPTLSDALNGERLPAYHRMDVAGSMLVYKRQAANYDNPAQARIGMSIYNVYNRQNVRDFIPNANYDPTQPTQSQLTAERQFLALSPNFFITLEF